MVSFEVDGSFAIDRLLLLPLQSIFPPYNCLVSLLKKVLHFFTRKSQLQRLLESSAKDSLFIFHHRLRRARSFSELEKKVGDPALCSKLMQFVEVSDSFSRFKEYFSDLCDQKKQLEINEAETKKLLAGLKELVIEKEILSRESFTWSDLGFQGENPISDLRSTGIASVLQITKLLDVNPELVKTALLSGYSISFACIAINCTAFLRDCLLGKGEFPKFPLDRYLLIKYQKSDFMEFDFRQDGAWMLYMNILFILMLEMVDREWKKQNPSNIMGFPAVFSQVKKDFVNDLQMFV
jgi:hypothetical protein